MILSLVQNQTAKVTPATEGFFFFFKSRAGTDDTHVMNSSRLLIRHGLGVLNDRYPSYTTSISSPDLWLVTKFVNGDKSTFSLHDFCCCWSCLSSSILSAEKQAMYIISAERKVEASPYQSRRQVGQRFSSGKRPRLNRLSNFDKTQSV